MARYGRRNLYAIPVERASLVGDLGPSVARKMTMMLLDGWIRKEREPRLLFTLGALWPKALSVGGHRRVSPLKATTGGLSGDATQ